MKRVREGQQSHSQTLVVEVCESEKVRRERCKIRKIHREKGTVRASK
jgi:hypothetical protein